MSYIKKFKKGNSIYYWEVEAYRNNGKSKFRKIRYIGKELPPDSEYRKGHNGDLLRIGKHIQVHEVKLGMEDYLDKTGTIKEYRQKKEKAYHFKKMQEQGLSLREIGRIFGYGHADILMYLNVFKLPDKYQEAVWAGEIPIGNIRELEPLFNGTYVPEQVTNWLDQKLTQPDLRKALNPTLAKFKEAQIEKAQKAVGEITPEVKLETPDDFAKAAASLKAKAKQLADELLTPEQRAELEAKKETDAATKAERAEEIKREKEEADRKREEKLRKIVIVHQKKGSMLLSLTVKGVSN